MKIFNFQISIFNKPASQGKFSAPGFTLIELVVGMFIFVILVLGIVAMVTDILKTSSKQGGVLADQDSGRRVVFNLTNELRNLQTGSDGSYPLALASPQEIVFYTPLFGQSGIQRVHYYVQNGNLVKGITFYAGGQYATSTEGTVIVQRHVDTAAGAIFTYFDGSFTGGGQSPLSAPVNVTLVRFVKISLPIYNTAGQAGTNYFSIFGGSAIRGLKTNLGS